MDRLEGKGREILEELKELKIEAEFNIHGPPGLPWRKDYWKGKAEGLDTAIRKLEKGK